MPIKCFSNCDLFLTQNLIKLDISFERLLFEYSSLIFIFFSNDCSILLMKIWSSPSNNMYTSLISLILLILDIIKSYNSFFFDENIFSKLIFFFKESFNFINCSKS